MGRTGSGKSTFVSALWRLVQLEGSLQVDGVEISTLGLKELRSRLAIIPQDPVLFNASVKYNLDPFDAHTEAKLHEVLEIVQMKAVVDGFADGLQQLALTLTPNPNHNPNPNPNPSPSPSPNPDQVCSTVSRRAAPTSPSDSGNSSAWRARPSATHGYWCSTKRRCALVGFGIGPRALG